MIFLLVVLNLAFALNNANTNDLKFEGDANFYTLTVTKEVNNPIHPKDAERLQIPFALICYKVDPALSLRMCTVANERTCNETFKNIERLSTLGEGGKTLLAWSIFSNSHLEQTIHGQFVSPLSHEDIYGVYFIRAQIFIPERERENFHISGHKLTSKFRYSELSEDNKQKELNLVMSKFFNSCQQITKKDFTTTYNKALEEANTPSNTQAQPAKREQRNPQPH